MNEVKKGNKFLNPIDLQLIELAIREDLGVPPRDLTTRSLFLQDQKPSKSYHAHILSKEKGPVVICGLEVIQRVFQDLDQGHSIETNYHDGDTLSAGETLLTIKDSTAQFLSAERIALNFLGHLSAIATLTAKFVEQIKDTPLKILDTRKTTPGMRHLEKYAVQCGGGVNHRFGLYDAMLIKNNHIDLYGGVENVLEKLPSLKAQDYPVILEIRNIEECKIVAQHGQDKINRLLFDNMSLKDLKTCVSECNGKIETEVSGGITLKNISAIAQTGVQFASIGMLTHSPGQIDFAMHVFDV